MNTDGFSLFSGCPAYADRFLSRFDACLAKAGSMFFFVFPSELMPSDRGGLT